MRRSDLFLSIIVLYFVLLFVVFCDIQRVFFLLSTELAICITWAWMAFGFLWDGMVVYQKSWVGLIDTIDVHIYIHINNYMVI